MIIMSQKKTKENETKNGNEIDFWPEKTKSEKIDFCNENFSFLFFFSKRKKNKLYFSCPTLD